MPDNRGKIIDDILDDAAKSGSIADAIGTHGSDLSNDEQEALKSLSKDEIGQLQNLRTKLAPLGRAVADVNGGVF